MFLNRQVSWASRWFGLENLMSKLFSLILVGILVKNRQHQEFSEAVILVRVYIVFSWLASRLTWCLEGGKRLNQSTHQPFEGQNHPFHLSFSSLENLPVCSGLLLLMGCLWEMSADSSKSQLVFMCRMICSCLCGLNLLCTRGSTTTIVLPKYLTSSIIKCLFLFQFQEFWLNKFHIQMF